MSSHFPLKIQAQLPGFQGFREDNDKFEIRALSVGGKLLPADQIDALAKLPTRDQAIVML